MVPVPYSKCFIFFLTFNWPNKLECCITLGWKGLPGTNTLAYCALLQVTNKIKFREYGPVLWHQGLVLLNIFKGVFNSV
jgi:hypothetical protein